MTSPPLPSYPRRRDTPPHRGAPICKDGDIDGEYRTEHGARACRISSGPCAKRPGWSLKALSDAPLGRSHRAKIGKDKLKLAIDLTREVLQVPADYRIGIVPASDTGAMEMAMWSMLGARGVDMLAWESFGSGWITDVVKQLSCRMSACSRRAYGELPNLKKVDSKTRDVVFTWNGTTSGVRVADASWIADDREGLTICDATSAAFAQRLDWPKLDVVTFSWQKVLGGEGAHGMIILVAARGRTARDLQAGLAAAEGLPHDERRQALRGHLRRRDHQHPVHALRRGLCRRAQLGEEGRRARRAGEARRGQCPRHRQVRARERLDRLPRGQAEDALEHLGLPEVHRPGRDQRCRPTSRRPSPSRSSRSSRRPAPATISAITATPLPACASGAAPPSRAAILKALAPWITYAFNEAKASLGKKAA